MFFLAPIKFKMDLRKACDIVGQEPTFQLKEEKFVHDYPTCHGQLWDHYFQRFASLISSGQFIFHTS